MKDNDKPFDRKAFARSIATDYGREVAESMFGRLSDYPFCAPDVSPIETMLGCALVIELVERIDPSGGVEEASLAIIAGMTFEDLVVPPFEGYTGAYQVKVGPYTVDFLITVRSLMYGTGTFVIECDGHDFHEKTKQQIERDKKRDRYLQAKGMSVFRFAGSEIWRDPRGVARSILDNADEAMRNRHEAQG